MTVLDGATRVLAGVAQPDRVATGMGRRDLHLIASLVPAGARVLDLGCGTGDLLQWLCRERGAAGVGVEISHEGVVACIAKGLPVHHADLDEGLEGFADGSFDYVILSRTLQAVHRPAFVLREMLRVGQVGIVSFPNFGYWRMLWSLLSRQRMPRTAALAHAWHETPHIHPCTIADFADLCHEIDIQITRQWFLAGGREIRRLATWRAEEAVYTISRLRA